MSFASHWIVHPTQTAVPQMLAGSLIWLVAVVALQIGWGPALFLFGPLVLFPMVLDLAANRARSWRGPALLAFLPVVLSFALEQGVVAGLLTAPWLFFSLVLLAYPAVQNIRTREYATLIIRAYLVVGASWLVLARLGIRPLDFEGIIVLATAVHFHYAGFILPTFARQLAQRSPSRAHNTLLAMLLVGMPLVAAGITLAAFDIHWVECAATWVFSAACIWFALSQLRFALTNAAGWSRRLMVLASLSLLSAMCLAFLYGNRHYWQTPGLDIPFMVCSHGLLQVFGFALPGVVAWAKLKSE